MSTHPHNLQNHLATILDSVADGVFTVDGDMHITWFNHAAELITGFSREEALGQRCCEIFRSSICFSECPVRKAMDTGLNVENREIDILDRHNREVPISVSASVLRDAQGEPVGGVETFRDLSRIHALQREVTEKYRFQDMVSRNPAMRKLFDVLPDIAASNATVLLQGDSGTGKELFARALHNLSPRSRHPLVILNCGALPEQLLEAEIFGARKGAYTGATEDRPGRLQQAEGGTLFLDEIGDLPLPLQVKLLRVLENREYQPLGARRPRKADVRFLAATHQNLEAMVEQKQFRQDLYFRLNVVPLRIPSLRERSEDIPLLLDMALDRFNGIYGKKLRGFSPEAMSLLLDYDYPGNVRELLNLVERAAILCRKDVIEPDHLPPGIRVAPPTCTPNGQKQPGMPSATQLYAVLARCKGNRTAAAQQLGINRSTLWRWLKRLDQHP
ncbi:sigma-54-dependent sensor transcriptional regulator, PAS domain-containing [Syntrophotalea carbinolica DSM 2380]|uniref:Sigma-54-dependent sensor transcriptional regulator, PAS domain-containing n=1 Tax=Syntrophotalea carbinolica (strain DSM 2380 / NBRC 103641 / GraBd1) TaxID=338963 RepID=Q3A6J7_SYNC1|nr:sigma-54-dependent Fis family transcriptional regulator [Syntrophotalea carbinolica]ABA88010.1 sigma-54-dependent sensor transcriptional regulator, PAS domain-containing [Syntrophotalea carbinolica DSM 2380]